MKVGGIFCLLSGVVLVLLFDGEKMINVEDFSAATLSDKPLEIRCSSKPV